ncbi:HNH endonuclease signature motif containing protein [Burkholderia cenocepacia]|uniref:HNH endonuclease signature motif containing protein n=1 Tax=Burkholderia cenocepacia TaxID=95486 RepID=UPI001903DE38|nr:HNH endonuclease signature motif containing protein [Burkholderia cenocepacia]MBJ9895227.1 HNH endonuclease [Burkholderia cenocepacia]MBJ9917669.1 HNH endonuclease [Burkholderia cenocepacia]
MGEALTAQRLRELLNYDQATGQFRWREKASHRVEVGDVAGSPDRDGYLKIQIKGKKYLAHRLAWLFMTGAWPAREVDHVNGVRADNRFSNLRAVTRSQNMQNQRRARSNSTTGLIGANRQGNGFQSSINIDGTPTYLGYFATPEAAHAAYVDAKRRHHEGCTL